MILESLLLTLAGHRFVLPVGEKLHGEDVNRLCKELCLLGKQYRELNKLVENQLLNIANNLLQQSVLDEMNGFLSHYLDVLCKIETIHSQCSVFKLKSLLSDYIRAMPEMLHVFESIFRARQACSVFETLHMISLSCSKLTSLWCMQTTQCGIKVLKQCALEWLKTGKVSYGCAEFFFIVDSGPIIDAKPQMFDSRFQIDVNRLPTNTVCSASEWWSKQILFCGLANKLLQTNAILVDDPFDLNQLQHCTDALEETLQDLAMEGFTTQSKRIRSTMFLGEGNVFAQPELQQDNLLLWNPLNFELLDSSSTGTALLRGQNVLISQDGIASTTHSEARVWFKMKIPVESGFEFTMDIMSLEGGATMWVCSEIDYHELMLQVHPQSGLELSIGQDSVLYRNDDAATATTYTLSYFPNTNTFQLFASELWEQAVSLPCTPALKQKWCDVGGNSYFGCSLYGAKLCGFKVSTGIRLPQPRLNVPLLLQSRSAALVFTEDMMEMWNCGAFPVLFRVSRTNHLLSQRKPSFHNYVLHQVSQSILQYFQFFVVETHFQTWKMFLASKPNNMELVHRFSREMSARINFDCCLGNPICRQALLRVLQACDRRETIKELSRLVVALIQVLNTVGRAPELVQILNFNSYWV